MFRITVGRALSSDRRVANIGKTAALIVIRALPYTEPTAPPEALPIGLGTHVAAGDTFADHIESCFTATICATWL
jgi:hypothetical protein